MASAMEEMDAGIELCQWTIADLRKKNPQHALLRFADNFAMMPAPREFVEQFGGEHIPEVHRGTEFAAAAMFNNYHKALKAAVEKPESPPSEEIEAMCET